MAKLFHYRRPRLVVTPKGVRIQGPYVRIGGKTGINVSQSGVSGSVRTKHGSISTRKGCSIPLFGAMAFLILAALAGCIVTPSGEVWPRDLPVPTPTPTSPVPYASGYFEGCMLVMVELGEVSPDVAFPVCFRMAMSTMGVILVVPATPGPTPTATIVPGQTL